MSDRHTTRKSLSSSSASREQRLLDFAVSQSPAVFYIAEIDEEQPIRFISSNVETITGHASSAFLSRAGYGRGFIHPDDLPAYRSKLVELESLGALTHEYRFRSTNGEYRWYRDALRLTKSEETGRTEFVGCMIDITAQKEAEAQLREVETLKSAIVGSALDAIVSIDGDGRIIEFNPAAEQMFGYGRNEVIGHSLSDLIIPEAYRARHAEGLRRFRETGEMSIVGRRMEIEALRADGSVFPVELTIGHASLGERTVFVGAIRDVTERREADAERQRLSRLLDDAIESLPHGFSIVDPDERIVLCNSAFASSYGHTPGEMVGRGREENIGEFLPNIRAVNGREITGSAADIAFIANALRRADVEPMEMELGNGEWHMVTAHPTSDGGHVTLRTNVTRLKAAEKALRESEQQFRRMVEGSPLPVWLIGLDTAEILYESPAAAELMGRDWPSSGSRSVLDHYADPDSRIPYLEQLRRDGEVRDYEIYARKTDGTCFWVSTSTRIVTYEGREVAVTTLVDLTERKQREDELKHARETLEDAIESLSEGFALYDTENRLVMCNERYREFNWRVAEMLEPGVPWLDLIRSGAERGQYVEAAGRIEEWIEQRISERGETSYLREFEQSDGRWFEAAGQKTRHGGTVVTRTEITHRKEAERALRESERLVRRVLEACPVPVAMVRAEDGVIIYESPAVRELFGRPEQRGPVSSADFYVDPHDRERYLARLREAGAVDGYEVQFKKADGTRFWAALSGRLVECRGEEVIVVATYDLTERQAVEAEMSRQRDALHQSEKLSALGELLAGVAHELNNPLSVVVGQALLLKEAAEEASITGRAAKIAAAADRCARIVKTFLAMARQQPVESEPVDLNDAVEAALEVTGYSLRASDIDVSLRLARDLPTIRADANQLNHVLTNLIINGQHALQEIPGERKLWITTSWRAAAGEVVVKVKDNGTGIPEEVRPRIFEPLFTTKPVGTGTGIGLAICHRIVESHGGKIEVESGAGEGATFIIRLPTAGPHEAGPAQSVETESAAEPCQVLVIDDEDDVAGMLADALRGQGHRVEIARSGDAALDMIEQRDFDAILSDIRMPGLDGPGLYRALDERSPGLVSRLAFITGDTMSPRVRSFLDSAGRPYIEKPITPDGIRALIGRIVGRHGEGDAEID